MNKNEMQLENRQIEIRVEPLLIDEAQTTPIRVVIINNLDITIKNVDVKVFLPGSEQPTEEIEQIRKGKFAVAQFTPPALKNGRYEFPIVVSYELKGKEEILREKRTLFVISKKKIKGESVTDIDFEDLLR